MLENNKSKIKQIIRICRTWPTENFNGIGLHAYNYSKFIDTPTKVFLKDFDKEDKPLLLSNVSIIKIKTEKYMQRKELGNINKVIIFGLTLSFMRATEI